MIRGEFASVNWNNVSFLYSAGIESNLRPTELPEVALVGRSNVGKSSLINHLLDHKDLARVSKSPGKTKLINFFDVDDTFLIADLPGYGYARVSHSEKERWTPLIENYLSKRANLQLVCQLIDARHPPTADDIAFAEWINKPLLYIFTKTDLISSPAIVERYMGILPQKSVGHIHYSIKTGSARQVLRGFLARGTNTK